MSKRIIGRSYAIERRRERSVAYVASSTHHMFRKENRIAAASVHVCVTSTLCCCHKHSRWRNYAKGGVCAKAKGARVRAFVTALVRHASFSRNRQQNGQRQVQFVMYVHMHYEYTREGATTVVLDDVKMSVPPFRQACVRNGVTPTASMLVPTCLVVAAVMRHECLK